MHDKVFNDAEALAVLHTLLSAGGESTTGLLGNAVRLLAENSDLQEHLRQHLGRIPMFVEEVLRLEPPFRYHMRVTTKDTHLGAVDIPADSTVLLLWGAASRDASVFERPDEIDLEREVPRRHVAFGRGIHHCVGAPLARIEARHRANGAAREHQARSLLMVCTRLGGPTASWSDATSSYPYASYPDDYRALGPRRDGWRRPLETGHLIFEPDPERHRVHNRSVSNGLMARITAFRVAQLDIRCLRDREILSGVEPGFLKRPWSSSATRREPSNSPARPRSTETGHGCRLWQQRCRVSNHAGPAPLWISQRVYRLKRFAFESLGDADHRDGDESQWPPSGTRPVRCTSILFWLARRNLLRTLQFPCQRRLVACRRSASAKPE